MTAAELSDEYEEQYQIIMKKVEKLEHRLSTTRGEDLYWLRRKIKVFKDMAYGCKFCSVALKDYKK